MFQLALKAYYPFDGNANDQSGNGYHASRKIAYSISAILVFTSLISLTFKGLNHEAVLTPKASLFNFPARALLPKTPPSSFVKIINSKG